jgi:hypothetical protein
MPQDGKDVSTVRLVLEGGTAAEVVGHDEEQALRFLRFLRPEVLLTTRRFLNHSIHESTLDIGTFDVCHFNCLKSQLF